MLNDHNRFKIQSAIRFHAWLGIVFAFLLFLCALFTQSFFTCDYALSNIVSMNERENYAVIL